MVFGKVDLKMEPTKPMEYCSKLDVMISPDHFRSRLICKLSGESCVGYIESQGTGKMSQQNILLNIYSISQCPLNPERKRLQSYLAWVNSPQTEKWQPPEE